MIIPRIAESIAESLFPPGSLKGRIEANVYMLEYSAVRSF
jgi:hypothetical protein